MRRSLALLLVLAALAVGVPAARAGGTVTDVSSSLESAIRRSKVREDRVGVAVLERGKPNPRVVFARGHTRALKLASVAKVLTAATALDLLGPGHAFQTVVTARGETDAAGTLHGDLVVHGSGDPNVSGRAYGGLATWVLDQLATGVAKAGIRRVTGALVLDDGRFDREWVHPEWRAADRSRWYGAPVGGLSFNDSCVDLVVKGGRRVGSEGLVETPSTTGPWRLLNRTETVASGDTVVGAHWEADGALSVSGKVPLRASYAFPTPVPDPVAYFGGAFSKSLAAMGVALEGGVRPAASAEDRRPGREVARHASSLATTLRVMNRRSQNFYAASLFKACGAALEGRGTWASGRRAVEESLRRRGLSDEGKTVVVDGSGLSLSNRATAATVARVLADLDLDVLRGPLLRDSLAVPGEEGTLDDRLDTKDLRARLKAKTGTLGKSGVHSLAGYLDGRDGRPGYAFAILVEDAGGRDLIDALVLELSKP